MCTCTALRPSAWQLGAGPAGDCLMANQRAAGARGVFTGEDGRLARAVAARHDALARHLGQCAEDDVRDALRGVDRQAKRRGVDGIDEGAFGRNHVKDAENTRCGRDIGAKEHLERVEAAGKQRVVGNVHRRFDLLAGAGEIKR